jgi:prepilin-type N-terminal cleavage/methylation domain
MRCATNLEQSESPNRRLRLSRAFTLIEVMIALGIFFMAAFSILALVSNTLRNARRLQDSQVDASMLAAQVMMTNRLYEGTESGDFGDTYPDYSYEQVNIPITNGLWQVDFFVHHHAGRVNTESKMSIFVFSPDSQGAPGTRR